MKTLYLIGGAMGVGKTTVGRRLQKEAERSVFLDGDWCWDASPFQVTDETRAMVLDNIRHLLGNFLHCSVYENIVFCWVMHEQAIIDGILSGLDTGDCRVRAISLTCDEATLRALLEKDIRAGLRTQDVIGRSLAYLPRYQALDTAKIDTTDKRVAQIVQEILRG